MGDLGKTVTATHPPPGIDLLIVPDAQYMWTIVTRVWCKQSRLKNQERATDGLVPVPFGGGDLAFSAFQEDIARKA